jgi:hypothetical protein
VYEIPVENGVTIFVWDWEKGSAREKKLMKNQKL